MGIFSCENFQRTMQGWICLIGLMALGNTISCFVSPSFIKDRLYTGAPDKANDLAARLFGMWTLVAALLRIFCAFCIENRPLYHLTFISFILALAHFLSEAFYYRTAPVTVGVIAPFIASSLSLVFMIIGYWCQQHGSHEGSSSYHKEDMPKRVEDIRLLSKNKRTKKLE